MPLQKLTSTDAFVAFDLAGAPASGVTRLAPKILLDGAFLLARSTTYAFAAFGVQRGGGSGGINAADGDRAGAVQAFVDEVRPLVAEGRWTTDPGNGLTEDDVAPLREVDPRPADLWAAGLAADLTGRGAVAAAAAVRDGGLDGAVCAFAGGGPAATAARAAAEVAGATAVDGGADSESDVLFLAGRTGMVDHDGAGALRTSVVVPLTPVPITARAHAVLGRAGVVHVPDFLSTAAPLLAAFDPEGGDAVERVGALVAELHASENGLWMAAVERAETFLRSWQETLPFGRPLA